MELKQILATITPEIYENLRRSIELGKWPDGRRLSKEQKELSIQAIIAYEKDFPEAERTGFVPPKGAACDPLESEEKPISWKSSHTPQSNLP